MGPVRLLSIETVSFTPTCAVFFYETRAVSATATVVTCRRGDVPMQSHDWDDSVVAVTTRR